MTPLDWWQSLEYVGSGVVILGVVGEYLAEFHIFRNREEKRRVAARWSTLILIAGLAIELLALTKTNHLYEKRIAELGDSAAQANTQAALANERSAKDELETAQLYELTSPRRLSIDQQTAIGKVLRKFAGRTVIVSSYGMDGEGASIGTQIISAFRSAGINAVNNLAGTVVTGGFESGIHVRGPSTEHVFTSVLGNALRSIGKLDVAINDSAITPSAAMGGNAVMGGKAVMGGGPSAVLPLGPAPPNTPVKIVIGIKPIKVIGGR